MTDLEIRDKVVVTLFGGYEATADALTWTWFLLGEHPHVDEKLREEVAPGDRRPAADVRGPDPTRVLPPS